MASKLKAYNQILLGWLLHGNSFFVGVGLIISFGLADLISALIMIWLHFVNFWFSFGITVIVTLFLISIMAVYFSKKQSNKSKTD